MTQMRTGVSLKETLLEETDNVARELDLPRSQVVALALEEFIQRFRNQKLLAQINETYGTAPEPDEIETFAILRSQQKKSRKSD